MATTPTGYRIYWSTTLADLYTAHPHPNSALSPAYDSPITVVGALTKTLPGTTDTPGPFWDTSMTKIYISVAAYFDDGNGNITEGVRSKPRLVGASTYTKKAGKWMLASAPLNNGDMALHNTNDLKTTLGSASAYYTNASGKLVLATGSIALDPSQGILIRSTAAGPVVWRGMVWENPS
jgi:hypothetical protein